MNHYQADPYNALEAISEAQKIAFGPMLFQASWCLRETGVLAYLETRGSQGAALADIAQAWQRIRGRVRDWNDLEPALIGRVEELIDFVTAPAD